MRPSKLPVVVLCFLILLTACSSQVGGGTVSSGHGSSWEELYNTGMRFLSEGNYEQAIIAFTSSIEIEEKHAEVYIGRGDAYVGAAKNTAAEAENSDSLPDKAVSLCQSAVEDYRQAIDLDPATPETYYKAAEACEWMGDIDAATDILERGFRATSNQTLQNYLEVLQAGGRDDLLRSLSTLLEQNNVEDAISLTKTSPYSALTSLRSDSFYICSENNENCIAVYPGSYYYFGSMIDGKRSGHGLWICTDFEDGSTLESYRFEGEWSNDLPNGSGIITESYDLGKMEIPPNGSVPVEKKIEGEFQNGQFNGTINLTWIMNDGYNMAWSPIVAVDGVFQPYPGEIPDYVRELECYEPYTAQGMYIVGFTDAGSELWDDGQLYSILGLGLQ